VISKGDRAPDFRLRGTDGHRVELSDLEGKVVVLAFYVFDFSPA
jgi:peroxiredoxin